MHNPIPHNSIFATLENFDSLYDYVSQFNGSELRIAMLVMMMTLNTCHVVVENTLVETE